MSGLYSPAKTVQKMFEDWHSVKFLLYNCGSLDLDLDIDIDKFHCWQMGVSRGSMPLLPLGWT